MEEQAVSDLIAYIKAHGDDSFSDLPFSSVDGLILAELSYIDWDGMGIDFPGDGTLTLAEAIAKLDPDYLVNELRPNRYELLKALLETERYGKMKISHYFAETTTAEEASSFEDLEQFAAVVLTYVDEDGDVRHYISFRGTDNTLEGWCEDFNMAYDSMTEAQKRAVEYLNNIADHLDGDFQLGGHSKGGNNAMYAYLFCDESIRERIMKIFIYDSPGFIYDLFYEDENGRRTVDPDIYKRMVELLKGSAICPYDSVIGQLLKEVDFIFVATTGPIFLDHEGFLWRVDPETGEFITQEQSALSKYLNELLDEWIMTLPVEYRETFMKAVWSWIYTLGEDSFDDVLDHIGEEWKEAIPSLISYIYGLPEEERKVFLESLGTLILLAMDNALEEGLPGYETIRQKIDQEFQERNIRTVDDLWRYLQAAPIENTMDLLQSIIMDWDTLVALVQASATVAVVVTIIKAVISLVQLAVGFVASNLPVIAAILAAVVVLSMAIDYIRQHWDELMGYVNMAAEFVQKKLEEFYAAMRLVITTGVHAAIAALVYQAKEIAEGFYAVGEAVVNVLEEMGRLASAAIAQALAISNPLLYTLLRTVTGLAQSAVTIDMIRLQNAVDAMDALATRIANMDTRLDTLYRQLCISNIQQGEGIFTSLANLYNLASADINVDQGNKIRRKANNLSSLFSGYREVESWALTQSGG